jgi:thymidylate synthase ThyX
MTIKVEINKDSINERGNRITTFVLTYPRFMHSEFMTHRMFSRNASSSRAIPVARELELIKKDPAIPILWTSNQKGMQGGAEISDTKAAEAAWLAGRDWAISCAEALWALGVHKQYVNRLLEPFSHISVVATATEFDNFFALRYHEMALPEICEVAKQMYELRESNAPDKLFTGEWHLPFVSREEERQFHCDMGVDAPAKQPLEHWMPLIVRSVARCARVSYRNHDGSESTAVEDKALYDRLLSSSPIHASPAEHQALCRNETGFWSGNFKNWQQYRKMLVGENITKFNK